MKEPEGGMEGGTTSSGEPGLAADAAYKARLLRWLEVQKRLTEYDGYREIAAYLADLTRRIARGEPERGA